MKKIIISILISTVICLSCKDKQKTGTEYNIDNPITAETYTDGEVTGAGSPILTFSETEYNFGTVIQGEKVSHSFKFKNTGDGNLIISNVKPSCGCTSPKWSKEPIKPGESGFVELIFDSSNRNGIQTKTAKVYTNTTPNSHDLVIRCDIATK